MADTATERQLWDLLHTDYKSAFRQLYLHNFKMIQHFIMKNGGAEADAEDTFQDAMIVLFNKSREQGFTLQCALSTYIYSVARNIWLKKLRQRNKQTALIDNEAYLNIPVEEEEEENGLLIDKVKTALANLGENCRQILLLFYYEKKNMIAIAKQLGYSNADNAKNQKYKCLQQLKSRVAANA